MSYKIKVYFFAVLALIFTHLSFASQPSGIVVLQTDYGNKDAAVSEVKGVMYSVNKSLIISELTQDIPPYNIWEASYRLYQAAPYWPKGTVFVSVVDPGVGTKRSSVVALSHNGYYFVTPDNGTLTFIKDYFGIKSVREIDEKTNRLPGSENSATFHGRDVYGYTAARLASGAINFAEVGPELKESVVTLSYSKPYIKDGRLFGNILVLDPQYGNVWTDISRDLLQKFPLEIGKSYKIKIFYKTRKKYEGIIPFQNTFGEVPKGSNLLYVNSLLDLAVGINQGNFAQKMQIQSGPDWHIEIEPSKN
jgi:S-adenosylmethionine hydrolase